MSFRRNLLVAGAATLLSVSAATAAGPKGTPIPRLPLPTGRVTYAVSHALMSGTSVLTWADGGKLFRQEAKLRVKQPGANGPVPTDISTTVLCDGKYVYTYNSQQGKTYRRMPVKDGQLPSASGTVPLSVDPKQTKLVGKGTVLGKPCEIREASRLRMWSWKGLPLKMEPAPGNSGEGTFGALLNSLRVLATKLEPGVKPAVALFKVPAGYKVVDTKLPSGVPGARPK